MAEYDVTLLSFRLTLINRREIEVLGVSATTNYDVIIGDLHPDTSYVMSLSVIGEYGESREVVHLLSTLSEGIMHLFFSFSFSFFYLLNRGLTSL